MKIMVLLVALSGSIAIHAADNANTIPEKAVLCSACHGPQGNSSNPEWPNIAGQHSAYIKKQLHEFKQGKTRNAPTMAAIVASLSDDDMTVLANYYSAQPVLESSVPEKYLHRGEQLYRGGDLDKHISACIACHGPKGTGNAEAGFPLLSGQHAPYTILQLQAFKNKTRQNDLNGIMHDISARMDPDDMKAVAWYIQGLF